MLLLRLSVTAMNAAPLCGSASNTTMSDAPTSALPTLTSRRGRDAEHLVAGVRRTFIEPSPRSPYDEEREELRDLDVC
jgi:hypothetical protein